MTPITPKTPNTPEQTQHQKPAATPGPSRRRVLQAAAWTTPAVVVAVAAPSAAASAVAGRIPSIVLTEILYTTAPGQVFDSPSVIALVSDADGPIEGASVTFTIVQPAADESEEDGEVDTEVGTEDDETVADTEATESVEASATFPGGLSTAVVGTDAFGIAMAPTLTAGAGTGILTISAVASTTGGSSSPVEASLRVIDPSFTMWSWGYGNAGALGIGNTANVTIPVTVQLQDSIASIGSGANRRTFIVDRSGEAWGWGSNSYSNLTGRGNATRPRSIAGLASASQIAGGYYTSYALLTDGTVVAWGSRGQGAIGNGGATGGTQTTPTAVAGLTDVTQVAAAWRTGYALRSDGTVWAWGQGGNGALGRGSTASSGVPVQVQLPAGRSATMIAGRYNGGSALLDDGTVVSWGSGAYGANGDGATADNLVPDVVTGVTNAIGIHSGWRTSGAVLADGTVRFWGRGSNYALGNGSTANALTAVVPALTGVTSLAFGDRHGHALHSSGLVSGWGYNYYGQVGNGTRGAPVRQPATVIGLTDATRITATQYSTYATTANPLED